MLLVKLLNCKAELHTYMTPHIHPFTILLILHRDTLAGTTAHTLTHYRQFRDANHSTKQVFGLGEETKLPQETPEA